MTSPEPVLPLGRRRRADPTLLPAQPVAYHQLLRGPRWRWWRPLVSLLLLVGLLLVALVVVFGTFEALDGPLPDRWVGTLDEEWSPVTNLELDLSLAALIPVAALAVAIAHRVRPGWVSSVTGRLRWTWLGRCLLVCLPVWALYLGVGSFVDPVEPGRPDH
ncbi:hypothetical protein [Microlunatus flavus]|uniref:Uncharacterized protein n=1 Tax=Microlunatus flavus TaxID=1036181 RepID=A0A1H9I4V5_9ACTN|nr:hypothetical protein [Microlunatus flavus]SEQ69455.1 hypothetical protein SAMN05421756_10578 [Microlunatus flavus]